MQERVTLMDTEPPTEATKPRPRLLAEVGRFPEKDMSAAEFGHHAKAAGLANHCEHLIERLCDIAGHHKDVFGFSFSPEDTSLFHAGDIRRIALGLALGVYKVPVVIDSPSVADVRRIGAPDREMLDYRVACLERSGLAIFRGRSDREWIGMKSIPNIEDEFWRPWGANPPTKSGGTAVIAASYARRIYEETPPPETLADRAGRGARIVFVADPLKFSGRVLTNRDLVAHLRGWNKSLYGAVATHARIASLETMLLLAGYPSIRTDDITRISWLRWRSTSTLAPHGFVAALECSYGGINIGCFDIWDTGKDHDILASSE